MFGCYHRNCFNQVARILSNFRMHSYSFRRSISTVKKHYSEFLTHYEKKEDGGISSSWVHRYAESLLQRSTSTFNRMENLINLPFHTCPTLQNAREELSRLSLPEPNYVNRHPSFDMFRFRFESSTRIIHHHSLPRYTPQRYILRVNTVGRHFIIPFASKKKNSRSQ